MTTKRDSKRKPKKEERPNVKKVKDLDVGKQGEAVRGGQQASVMGRGG